MPWKKLFMEKSIMHFVSPAHPATTQMQEKVWAFVYSIILRLRLEYAQKKLGVRKVLIVDWDVHHGNGTQDIFYEDDSVFFFSTHQSPWYPGTGRTSGNRKRQTD